MPAYHSDEMSGIVTAHFEIMLHFFLILNSLFNFGLNFIFFDKYKIANSNIITITQINRYYFVQRDSEESL